MRRLALALALALSPAAHSASATSPDDVLALLQGGEITPAEAARRWSAQAEEAGSVQARLHLARLEAGRGASETALAHLHRALEIAPNAEDVLDAIGRLALTVRDPVQAIRVLEPLARMHPSVPDYPYLLGVALLQAGDPAAAEEALREALRRRTAAPGGPETARAAARERTALGLVLNQQKRYAEARLALEESLRLSPGEIEARAALAEALEGAGEIEAAESQAERVIEEAEAHPTAHLVLGLIHMKHERWAAARDAFTKVVAARPDMAKAHYQLSLAWARLGDQERSRRHRELYQRALDDLEAHLVELRSIARETTTAREPGE